MSRDSNRRPIRRAGSPAFLAVVFVVLQVVQVLVYHRSFNVRPAGDDYGSPLSDIHVVRNEGMLTLFVRSNLVNYRPLQSVAMWAAAELFDPHIYTGIRILHFLSMAALGAVAALWLWEMRVGRAGAVVAGAFLFFHPTIVTPVASIDGFATPLCAALTWFGAWCVLRLRDRPIAAIAMALVVFFVAVGFKEFAFAMAPLCAWTMLWFTGPRRRSAWVRAIAVGAAICVGVAIYMWVRSVAIPPSDLPGGMDKVSLSLRQVGQNMAVYAVGLLFPGNSVWVALNRGPQVYALVAVSAAVSAAIILLGLWRRVRDDLDKANRWHGSIGWVVFLVIGAAAASFPASVTDHISEMYLSPVLLPLALLCALAGDGLANWRGSAGAVVRMAVVLIGIGALGWSITAIRSKIDDLITVGAQADSHYQKVLAAVPADVPDLKVLIYYLRSQHNPRLEYSIYRMADWTMVANGALDWGRPGLGQSIRKRQVDEVPGEEDWEGFDLVLLWDVPSQQFQTLYRGNAPSQK